MEYIIKWILLQLERKGIVRNYSFSFSLIYLKIISLNTDDVIDILFT
jgi:hypothetical protein